MRRLTTFFSKSRADRRLLAMAAVLHPLVSIALRLLSFARVRSLVRRLSAIGRRPAPVEGVDIRTARAVTAIASLLPGSSCLTDALVAQCLLARHGVETTLCFGVAPGADDGRPFDAHAWLERAGAGLLGARAIAYDPLRPPPRRAPSPSSR